MERATRTDTTIEINAAINEAVKKISAVLLISEYFCSISLFDVKSPDDGVAGRGQNRLNIDIYSFSVII